MDKEEIFTPIEEIKEKTTEEANEEMQIETPFIIGLPQWDLEPPYETIKRGNKL